jgi:hypothetical protein
MNTPGAVRRIAKQAGLQIESLQMVEKEPSYGRASRALFLGFLAYERLVNSSKRLAFARANLFGSLKRPPL